jgi:tetratricopeptide (TPR) repeat protein
VAHDRIGNVFSAQDNYAAALQSYRDSSAILDRLARGDPGNAVWRGYLSICDFKIGYALQAQGHLAEALQSYRESLTIRRRLAEADQTNTDWQAGLVLAYDGIGNVLETQGDLAQALDNYKAGLAIADSLVKADQSNADWQGLLVTAHGRVGDVLRAQGDLAGAFTFYRRGLALAEGVAKADPGNPARQRTLQGSIAKIGAIAYNFVLAQDFAKALEAADTAIVDAPEQLWLQLNRAHALMFLGDTDEARALYLRYQGQRNVVGNKSWEQAIVADFAELQAKGITHPLMVEIEASFGETKTATPQASRPEQSATPAADQSEAAH